VAACWEKEEEEEDEDEVLRRRSRSLDLRERRLRRYDVKRKADGTDANLVAKLNKTV
jgi:hypothetical protein